MTTAFLALTLLPSVACAKTHGLREQAPHTWVHWEAFREHFISADGRVIDYTSDGRTTSEGQAYALFFALVANDREQFDWLLSWTQNNLAMGDLRKQLPGWLWGQDRSGSWHLLDANAAADADLWIIYTLLEASRLWREPSYRRLAARLAQHVIDAEVDELPGLGPTLIPGPEGFRLEDATWRLNPSYVPLPVLRRLAVAFPRGPWGAILDSSVRLLQDSSTNGFAQDWVAYREEEGFIDDPVGGPVGSYDAIRTYLWAGLTHEGDENAAAVRAALAGLADHWRETGAVPERIVAGIPDTAGNNAPPGFYGALLPLLAAQDDDDGVQRLLDVIESQQKGGLYGSPPAYYDQALLLFALGNVEGRYRFAANGRLEPGWGRRWKSP